MYEYWIAWLEKYQQAKPEAFKKSIQGHQHSHEGQCEVLYTLHAQGNVLLAVKCVIHATRQDVILL